MPPETPETRAWRAGRAASAPPASREVRAFAPGRVNLIGEHTDYNGGLALPFAIAEGVTVRARAGRGAGEDDEQCIRAYALDLDEEDEFPLARPESTTGWRAFARGMTAELSALGVAIPPAELEIRGAVPRGAGLSSSAALEVALGLALLTLADAELEHRTLAAVCSRFENRWVGAHSGLLDQLASLFGEADTALRIDFTNLEILPVPLILDGGWQLVIADSGERRELAASGYNERRAECAKACQLLGIDSLRDLEHTTEYTNAISQLPETLTRRVRHVLDENARVVSAVTALRIGDLHQLGTLLNESHTSLREQYECSTPVVEATVQRLRNAGAAGARMVGGGFGGSVVGLFPPDTHPPTYARDVYPSRGAYVASS